MCTLQDRCATSHLVALFNGRLPKRRYGRAARSERCLAPPANKSTLSTAHAPPPQPPCHCSKRAHLGGNAEAGVNTGGDLHETGQGRGHSSQRACWPTMVGCEVVHRLGSVRHGLRSRSEATYLHFWVDVQRLGWTEQSACAAAGGYISETQDPAKCWILWDLRYCHYCQMYVRQRQRAANAICRLGLGGGEMQVRPHLDPQSR